MAEIGALYPTLLDIAKKTDPNGAVADVVETLSKTNPILDDIAWKEGNLPTGHRYTSRSALPPVGWRRFNAGIDAGKSTTEQYDETCGMLEGLSKVDCDLAKLNGNEAAYRADEDKAFVQALNIEAVRALFYESAKLSPDRIHGFTPRLDATSGNPAAGQIIKADASASGSDQTSIWLVGWSPETVFGIYPKASAAGLTHEDLGKQVVRDSANREFTAYMTKWQWKMGLCVRDFRYLVRGCNIDTSGLKADAATGADLPMFMQDMLAALFDTNSVQPVFYMNRNTFSFFNKQLMKKSSNFLEYVERGGRRVPHYLGFPIRVVDALTNSESVVA